MNCPEKKHILLITTGGTIASMPGGQGLEPRRSDVLERELNQLRTYYHISIQDLMCLDSSNIQPEEWVIIARAISVALSISLEAPVVTVLNTISSAALPARRPTSIASSSFLVFRNFSSSGVCIT